MSNKNQNIMDGKYNVQDFQQIHGIPAEHNWANYYAWVNYQYTKENNMYLESISKRLKVVEEIVNKKA